MPVTWSVIGADGRRIGRRLSRPAADSLARRVERATGETPLVECEQPDVQAQLAAGPVEGVVAEEPRAVDAIMKPERKSRGR